MTFHRHRIPLSRRPLPLVDLDAAGAEEVERGGGQVRREGGDPRVPRLLALRAGKHASRAQGRDCTKQEGNGPIDFRAIRL